MSKHKFIIKQIIYEKEITYIIINNKQFCFFKNPIVECLLLEFNYKNIDNIIIDIKNYKKYNVYNNNTIEILINIIKNV